jgi:DNA topoisomerase-1
MGKSLVIVESPAKAKTINKYLGKDFEVEASFGHIMDLPKRDIGVELAHRTFEPTLVVSPDKEKVVQKLRKLAARADAVYLAPDPDREGEAIAAHLEMQLLPVMKDKSRIRRVTFNEITQKAVRAAFEHARDVDKNLVDAQQTRRVLDRIVGYQISPLLWDKVRRGLSAGRVQTVAVRLIVEREKQIQEFKPVEYWTIDAILELEKDAKASGGPQLLTARFVGIDGERAKVEGVSAPAVPNEQEARAIIDATTAAAWSVASVERKERRSNPYPPFITSTLQQQAAAAWIQRQAHHGRRAAAVRRRGSGRGRLRRPDHLYAYRFHAHCARGDRGGAGVYRQEAGEPVFAGAAQRVSLEEGCAGCARGDSADRSRECTRTKSAGT